jgi:hypothetical protein
VPVTPEQVKGWGEVIRPDPVLFLAVILFLSTLLFMGLWIRSRQRVETLKDEERARDDKESARLQTLQAEHKNELLAYYAQGAAREREERDRNFMHLQVAQGFLRLVQDGALVVRQWDEMLDPPPKRRSSPGNAPFSDVATISLKLPPGGNRDDG